MYHSCKSGDLYFQVFWPLDFVDPFYLWVKDSLKQNTNNDAPQTNGANNKKQQRQTAAEKRKLLQPLRNKLKTLEKKIDKLNGEKADIEKELADNSIYDDNNKQQLKTLLEQQVNVTQSLDKVEEDWLLISDEIEALQQDS